MTPTRIAMWSGPRNLSTAMMYSFAARGDCTVVDEPLYAAYLAETGVRHPMQEAILRSQPNDANAAISSMLEPISTPFQYQKHMTHHMTDAVPVEWMRDVRNVFLIRHPARVIASYAAKREAPTLDDLGFVQQARLFDVVRTFGQAPVVIDSADIRQDPAHMLRKLCAALDMPYTDAMLSWPAGGHASDGVWAAHWYGAVHRSTGFAGPEGRLPELEKAYADLAAQALPIYERLAALKLT